MRLPRPWAAFKASVLERLPVLGPVGAVVLLTVGLVLILELGSHRDSNPLAIGKQASDLALPHLERPGDTLRLASLRGQVVLLEMWNTVCENCRQAMPAAESLGRQFSQEGLVVVHVANEDLADSARMRRFLDDNDLTGMVVVDDHRTFLSTYQIWAVPWSVLLDREGKVAWQYPGVVRDAVHPLLTEEGQAVLQRTLEN